MTAHEGKARCSARIASLRALNEKVVLIGLTLRAPYSWRAGQYLALSDSPEGGELSYYSIASAQDETRPEYLELVVTEAAFKHSLQVGADLFLEPPGGGVSEEMLRGSDHLVFIGMGTGIAPLRAMMQELARSPRPSRKLTLVQGSRTKEECLFLGEFEEMGWEHFEHIPVLSRPKEGWEGRLGRVQGVISDLPIVGAHYFVCGSASMVEDVRRLLGERGLPEASLFAEGH